MGIYEEVEELLKSREVRETKQQMDRKTVEGFILAELVQKYNLHLKAAQWEDAQDCLQNISRLVVAMLAR